MQSFCDDLFRVAEAVNGGGIDPVDARVEASVDRFDGGVVILGAPRESVSGPTYRPRADPDPGDLQVAIAKTSLFHPGLLRGRLTRS